MSALPDTSDRTRATQGRPRPPQESRILMWMLLFVGSYQPLSIVAGWLRFGARLDPMSIWLATLNTVVAWSCLIALRRGLHRGAAMVFVGAGIAQLWISYWHWGLAAQLPYQLMQLLLVLAAGLLLGRRGVWVTVAGVIAAVVLGAWRDVAMMMFPRGMMAGVIEQALHAIVGFVVVSAVFDAALSTLRRSLRTARRRSDELARSRDRLQLEMQEKERSRDQLVHAQKMEAVGRLASGVAHDFNHLLSLVLGYARRGQRSRDPAQMHEALQGAELAARRATAVTRKLLDFSRLETNRPELFDAAVALADMQPMLRQLLRPEIALDLALAGPAPVRFDRAQLELIVLTLASNADDAMADGGGFTVSVACSAGEVRIEAADTGTGMSAEALARCFDPFFTTKPAGQGTGLGLAVAHQLVEAAGGRMDVDSVQGQGCRFSIQLPRAAA